MADINARPINVETREDQTQLEATTEFFLKTSTLAASTINSVGNSIAKDHIDFQYAKAMLERSFKKVSNGDLSEIEEMLYTQSYALNAIFASMVARSSRQEYRANTQLFMNLALKAQNQSRATLQALIQLKQPNQTAFIKQTNIAHGHQQVNNGTQLENKSNSQNKLLGDINDLDTRTKAATKPVDSQLDALELLNRGENS